MQLHAYKIIWCCPPEMRRISATGPNTPVPLRYERVRSEVFVLSTEPATQTIKDSPHHIAYTQNRSAAAKTLESNRNKKKAYDRYSKAQQQSHLWPRRNSTVKKRNQSMAGQTVEITYRPNATYGKYVQGADPQNTEVRSDIYSKHQRVDKRHPKG